MKRHEQAERLRDLDIKVRNLAQQVALARLGRLNNRELAGRLEAEWLRVRSDLKALMGVS